MLRICDRDLRSNEVARNHEVISRMGKGTHHCDAINVFCEGTVTFVGTAFTAVRSRKRECTNRREVKLSEEWKLKREEWREKGAAHGNKCLPGTDGNGSPSPAGKVDFKASCPLWKTDEEIQIRTSYPLSQLKLAVVKHLQCFVTANFFEIVNPVPTYIH